MAESILKLRVESSEYDQKIKRAAEGLQAYAEGCRKAGGTLTQLDDGVLEFTKALGNMETVSKSARGSVNEMTKAFTELSVQYKKLTEEEKNSPFGKALAESLNTLKGRIQEGKGELDDINKSLNGGGGLKDALDAVAGKFGLSTDLITKFGGVVGVTTTALKIAKDAFFQSETNVDDWGRTVAAAEGVYDSFLQTLNNGDFSGFLQRLGEVINKAQEAYNALDELNTRMTIINPERTRLQARATELKAIIRRQGADSEAGQAAQQELRQLESKLTQAFKTESQLNMNAFKAQVDARLKSAGITLSKKDYDWLMKSFSSDEAYMSMKRGASGRAGREAYVNGSYDEGSVQVDTRNLNQKLLDLFTGEWRKEYAPLLNAAFSAQGGAASTMLSDARYLKDGGGRNGSGGGGGNTNVPSYAEDSIAAQSALVSELTKKWNEAGETMRTSYLYELIQAENKLKDMKDEQSNLRNQEQARLDMKPVQVDALNISDSLMPTLESIQKKLDANPIVIHVETAMNDVKAIQETARTTAKVVGSIGTAFNAIEDPAAKVASTVAQAIANVALAYSDALAKTVGEKFNIWSFLAAAAASTVSMVSTIASIHSATGYAQGGMIKGNSYSGDNIGGLVDGSQLVGLNAGEIVLNQAQQANVASGLTGGVGGNLNLHGVIKGEDILITADRSARRQGKGELVFWR